MRILQKLSAGFLFGIVLLTGGCTEDSAPAAPPKGPEAWFPIGIGGTVVKMQLAVRPLEMQQGLMHRPFLGDDEAMVFVYPEPIRMSFWMRNTLIPLDIGYFDREGVLREIHAMNPLDESLVQSISDSVQFAVEVNQGWYRARGLKPGARLDLAALRKALEARGFDPKAVGNR